MTRRSQREAANTKLGPTGGRSSRPRSEGSVSTNENPSTQSPRKEITGRRGAPGVLTSKRKKNAELVSNSISNDVSKLQGQVDALTDILKEGVQSENVPILTEGNLDGSSSPPKTVATIDGVDHPGQTNPTSARLVEPVVQPNCGSEGVKIIQQKALIHFLANGYNDRAYKAFFQRAEYLTTKYSLPPTKAGDMLAKAVTDVYYRHVTYRSYFLDWLHGFRKLFVENPLAFFGPFVACVLVYLICHYLLYEWSPTGYKLTFFLMGIALMTHKLLVHLCSQQTLLIHERKLVGDYCCSSVVLPDHVGKITQTTRPRCIQRFYPYGFTIAHDVVWLPRSCSCNELVGLTTRQMLPTLPGYWPELWNGAATNLEHVLPCLPFRDSTLEDFESWVCKYRGSRANHLRRVRYSHTGADTPSFYKSHVKVEYMLGKETAKRNPRVITASSDEFLVTVGPTYHMWQKDMCNVYWSGNNWKGQKIIYAGGKRADELGEIISYFEQTGYEVAESDFSRMDGHVEFVQLEQENEYYQTGCSGEGHCPTEFSKCMSSITHTSGTTMTGTKFKYRGKRHSGEISTSLGNSLITSMVYLQYFIQNRFEDWVLLVLGDDSMVFHKEYHFPGFVNFVQALGHKIEFTNHFGNYNYSTFCSSYAWMVGPNSRVLGPKIGKLLSKTFMLRENISPSDIRARYRGIALGFKYYQWVPVLRVVVASILRATSDLTDAKVIGFDNPYKMSPSEDVDADMNFVIAHFTILYGFDPISFEKEIESVDWSVPGRSYHHPYFDVMLKVDGVIPEVVECDVYQHLEIVSQ